MIIVSQEARKEQRACLGAEPRGGNETNSAGDLNNGGHKLGWYKSNDDMNYFQNGEVLEDD